MSEDEFIAVVTNSLPLVPGYFVYDAVRNRQARDLLDQRTPPPVMSYDQLRVAVRDGAVVLDTREWSDFAAGHLAGSVSVSLSSRFAEYAGSVIEPERSIVLVSDPGTALEAKVRLGRIGFDTVIGELTDVPALMAKHHDVVARSSRLTVAQLDERRVTDDVAVVDVRRSGETELGIIPGALALPLDSLRWTMYQLDPDRPTVVYCATGNRSLAAMSLLAANGFRDVCDLVGGYGAFVLAHGLRRAGA